VVLDALLRTGQHRLRRIDGDYPLEMIRKDGEQAAGTGPHVGHGPSAGQEREKGLRDEGRTKRRIAEIVPAVAQPIEESRGVGPSMLQHPSETLIHDRWQGVVRQPVQDHGREIAFGINISISIAARGGIGRCIDDRDWLGTARRNVQHGGALPSIVDQSRTPKHAKVP